MGKYQSAIEKKQDSITEYNAASTFVFGDVVSPLLASIAGKQIYVDAVGAQDVKTFWHKPNAFFDQDYNIKPACSRPFLTRFVDEVSKNLEKSPRLLRAILSEGIVYTKKAVPVWTENIKKTVKSIWDGITKPFGKPAVPEAAGAVPGIIGGAAYAGGAAATGRPLRFDATRVAQAAGEIRSRNAQMNQVLESVQRQLNRLENGWDGGAGDAMLLKFQRLATRFPVMYNDINTYAAFLDKSVAEYERTELGVTEKAAVSTGSFFQ